MIFHFGNFDWDFLKPARAVFATSAKPAPAEEPEEEEGEEAAPSPRQRKAALRRDVGKTQVHGRAKEERESLDKMTLNSFLDECEASPDKLMALDRITFTEQEEKAFLREYGTLDGGVDFELLEEGGKAKGLSLKDIKMAFALMKAADIDEAARYRTINKARADLLRNLRRDQQAAAGGDQGQEDGAYEEPPMTEEDVQVERQGTPQDYLSSFQEFVKTDKFNLLAKDLETNIQLFGNETIFNPQNWQTADGEELAQLFETQALFPFGTKAKGKGAFLDGVRLPVPETSTDVSPQAQKSRESRAVVGEISKIMLKHFEKIRTSREDSAKQVDKPALPEVLNNGVKSLLANFKRGSGMDKALIIGAVVAGLWVLNKIRKTKVGWGEKTWGDFAIYGAAIWGLNYLSGKVSKDGMTLTQRLGLFQDIDDLKDDNVLKAFAEQNGMRENQEDLRTIIHLKGVDVKKLYRVYKESSSGPLDQRRIDPRDLGFYNNEIDGESAYKAMRGLIEVTALTHLERRKREEDIAAGRPPARLSPQEEERALANADQVFEEEYIYGPMADYQVTFFDAVAAEYRTKDLAAIVAHGQNSRLFARGLDTAKHAAEKVGDAAIKYVPIGWHASVDFVRKYGGALLLGADKHVLSPTGRLIAAKYNKYKPYIEKPVETWEMAYQRSELDKVFKPEYDVQVTKPDALLSKDPANRGEMTFMGYPFKFSLTKKEDPRDKSIKDVAIIDDGTKKTDFFFQDGLGAPNDANADHMKDDVTAKVKKLVEDLGRTPAAARLAAALGAGNVPQWNQVDKKWEVPSVTVNGDADIGVINGTKTLTFTIDKDRRTLHFFVGEKAITDFAKLDEIYQDAEIEETIWSQNTTWAGNDRLEKLLRGLPVKITRPIRHGPPTIIEGTIGGLKFLGEKGPLTLPSGNQEILFYDTATSSRTEKFNVLTISPTNGDLEFLGQLQGKLLHDPYFTGPFNVLKAQMANTGEGFLARLKEGWEKKHPKGVINGKILQDQWDATLEFKQNEILMAFEHALLGKPLNQLPFIYHDFIEQQHVNLDNLSRYIASLPDEKIGEDFEDLLGGPSPSAGARGGIFSLEYAGYRTPEYMSLFKKFKDTIQEERFNYEGLDKSDLGGGAYYDIYNVALNAFGRATRTYMFKTPWDPAADTPTVEVIIRKIANKLEVTQNANGGVIKKKDLPGGGSLDEPSLDLWVR